MEPASKRLINRAKKFSPGSPGVGLEDIGRLVPDRALEADLAECLTSDDPTENLWGLFFCEGLHIAAKLAESTKLVLLPRIPVLRKSPDDQTRSATVPVEVSLRESLPKFKEWMLEHLTDKYVGVRKYALGHAEEFLSSGEIEALLPFVDDPYIAETSMDGPCVYPLRNAALEKIETLVNERFEKREKTEALPDGDVVFWWDWSPFLEWWAKHRRR